VTNEGRRRVSNLYFHVDWKKLPALPARTAYFHARYRQQLPAQAEIAVQRRQARIGLRHQRAIHGLRHRVGK
jgi:hypothetical protein